VRLRYLHCPAATYVGPGYYSYGYYYPAAPTDATQRAVPAQSYGFANGADARNIPPASQRGAAYVSFRGKLPPPFLFLASYPDKRWVDGLRTNEYGWCTAKNSAGNLGSRRCLADKQAS
jgi:hypothetical protein